MINKTELQKSFDLLLENDIETNDKNRHAIEIMIRALDFTIKSIDYKTDYNGALDFYYKNRAALIKKLSKD